MVKKMNKHYSTFVKEPGSQAERLAKMNFEILKRQADEARIASGQKIEEEEEEDDKKQGKKKEDGPYYTLNLHVKELREPRHSQQPLTPGKPCENFNRYYLPNG